MKILAGRSHASLAKHIAEALGLTCINASIQNFEDQELRIQITDPVYEEDVVIIQSTSKPANDFLMELLLLVDTAKRAGARRVIAVMPYFGYSRQDRPSYDYGPISARLIATLLEAAGVDHLITVDLHSKQAEGFFKIGVQNVETTPLFLPHLSASSPCVIVSPDVGGLARARQMSELLHCEVVVINKTRDKERKCHMSTIIGEVQGKHCIIVDDIVDTAGTLCQAANLLIAQGAKTVEACITHGVLSQNAIERIAQSPLQRILLTDTIATIPPFNKLQLISITDLMCQAIRRVTHL